ncbi:MAG: VOC family protein [Micromonosporaceae bacterium]
MAIAQFKDLCIDANDAQSLGEFYSAALGLRFTSHRDGDGQADGTQPQERIWFNAVPEPKTGKLRVHLDVHTDSVAGLEALGARVIRPPDEEIHWTVMADPEGGEFCAFVRPDPPRQRIYAVIVDAADAAAQATWWADVFGGHTVRHRNGWWSVADIAGAPFESMLFIEVPEPKLVKNRVHWDVESGDPDALTERGATVLREPDAEIAWRILADPEGNEFCAFDPNRRPRGPAVTGAHTDP